MPVNENAVEEIQSNLSRIKQEALKAVQQVSAPEVTKQNYQQDFANELETHLRAAQKRVDQQILQIVQILEKDFKKESQGRELSIPAHRNRIHTIDLGEMIVLGFNQIPNNYQESQHTHKIIISLLEAARLIENDIKNAIQERKNNPTSYAHLSRASALSPSSSEYSQLSAIRSPVYADPAPIEENHQYATIKSLHPLQDTWFSRERIKKVLKTVLGFFSNFLGGEKQQSSTAISAASAVPISIPSKELSHPQGILDMHTDTTSKAIDEMSQIFLSRLTGTPEQKAQKIAKVYEQAEAKLARYPSALAQESVVAHQKQKLKELQEAYKTYHESLGFSFSSDQNKGARPAWLSKKEAFSVPRFPSMKQ